MLIATCGESCADNVISRRKNTFFQEISQRVVSPFLPRTFPAPTSPLPAGKDAPLLGLPLLQYACLHATKIADLSRHFTKIIDEVTRHQRRCPKRSSRVKKLERKGATE
ncbi:hypothetical protein BaRGS_00015243 [Batillaria attramentaria]|uniref:Uncharacterized protein n=1 Tax=Batillaria attramentaria TaxID=370345 RepID=A0ABD0L2A6_9CAEN